MVKKFLLRFPRGLKLKSFFMVKEGRKEGSKKFSTHFFRHLGPPLPPPLLCLEDFNFFSRKSGLFLGPNSEKLRKVLAIFFFFFRTEGAGGI